MISSTRRQFEDEIRDPLSIDAAAARAVGWSGTMTTGTPPAYGRKIAWAKQCNPKNADPETVYVFDAKEDTADLRSVQSWLAEFSDGLAPLTVVFAPKQNLSMTVAERAAFETATQSSWVYPLSRPSNDANLLGHVAALLPPDAPVKSPVPASEIPSLPDYSMFEDLVRDDQAWKRLARKIDLKDRLD